jgi:hypothetical protein
MRIFDLHTSKARYELNTTPPLARKCKEICGFINIPVPLTSACSTCQREKV